MKSLLRHLYIYNGICLRNFTLTLTLSLKGEGIVGKAAPIGAAFLLGIALTLTLSQRERESREQRGYLSDVVLTWSTARTILS